MNTGVYLMSTFLGGAIGGAIGASAGQNADHPVIKGAIVNGLISTVVGVLLIPIAIAEPRMVGTTAGVGHLPPTRGFP